MRAPVAGWIVLARIAWLLNLRRGPESAAATRLRAQRVAEKLGKLAIKHDSVLVVGHGFFNALLGRSLCAIGWQGPKILPSRHWSAATYTL
jgi:broad specificity phosphatase PhoE